MSIADLFQKLGAPLKNTRWSWGAVSEDGTVYLRVWADQFKKIGGKQTVQVTHHERFTDDLENLGYKERIEQVERIRAGAKSYCILCQAKDPTAKPRELKSFDDRRLLVGGELIRDGEEFWLELVRPIKVKEIL